MFRVDGALVPLKNGERMMPDEIQKIAFDDHEPGAEGSASTRTAKRTSPTGSPAWAASV